MNINATIILQVINFGIAYFLFRLILLRPAYAAIAADSQKKEQLEHLVADDKQRIDRCTQELVDQRHANYLFFKKHMPQAVDDMMIDRKSLPSLEPASLDARQQKEIKERLSKDIITAIGVYNDDR